MPIRTQSQPNQFKGPPTRAPGRLIRIAHHGRHAAPEAPRGLIFRTTDQLLESEQDQMRSLFVRVFNKTMTADAFKRKFFHTPKGYSYHGLMVHAGVIVGAYSAVPGRYTFFDGEHIFALCVDTMIDPQHRGGGHILRMANLVHQALFREGIPFIFGFPNERFYPVQKKLLKYDDIGELDYYALPLNIGTILRRSRRLNGLSRSLCRCMTALARIPKDSDVTYAIAKIADEQFERHRYDHSYNRIVLREGAVCMYKIYEEEGGIRALYIVDVVPLTPAYLSRAVKCVLKAASGSADVIIYVGRLPSRSPGLWKVPDSRKPQRIRMTGKILIPHLVDESLFDLNNWRVNISDFDVR